MKPSTITKPKRKLRLWAVLVWLAVWWAASLAIGHEILLPSPGATLSRLAALAVTAPFWRAVGFSVARILAGFLLALTAGALCAALASFSRPVRELLEPPMLVMKSTPVASFIILCLIWIPSRNLSVFTGFLLVFPIVYTNLLEGIRNTDPAMLEMAGLFGVSRYKRARYIYLSQVIPYLRSACAVSLGFCWKAGIAAEVIGIPSGSIGESLYESKLYIDIPSLFAWTVVIILASVLFERVFLRLLGAALGRLERM